MLTATIGRNGSTEGCDNLPNATQQGTGGAKASQVKAQLTSPTQVQKAQNINWHLIASF